MDKMIVGLSGLSGSGKDAVADILVNEYEFTKISMADGLKRIVRDLYEFDYDQLWGNKKNEGDKRYVRDEHVGTGVGKCLCCSAAVDDWHDTPCYLTPRYALQIFGTEAGRACWQDTWLAQTMKTVDALLAGYISGVSGACAVYRQMSGLFYEGGYAVTKRVVIPDCRFISEMGAIMKRPEGRLIRILRPGLDEPKWSHPSETEALTLKDKYFSAVLHNDGDLNELGGKVGTILEYLQHT